MRKWLKIYLLKYELKRHLFVICGYKNKMVRVLGKRFLDEWEVELVHKWKNDNKIIECGSMSIISTATNELYNQKTYKLI